MDYLQSDDAIQFWQNLSTIVDGFFGIMSVGADLAARALEWLVENFDDVVGAATVILPFLATGFIMAHSKALLLGIGISTLISYFKNLQETSGYTLSQIIQKSVTAIAWTVKVAAAVGGVLVDAFWALKAAADVVLSAIAFMLKGILTALGKLFNGLATLGSNLQDTDLSMLGLEAVDPEIKAQWDANQKALSNKFGGTGDKLLAAADALDTYAMDKYYSSVAAKNNIGSGIAISKSINPEDIGKNVGDLAAGILDKIDAGGGINDWLKQASDAANQTSGAGSGVPVEGGAVASKIKGGKLDSSGEVQLSDEDIALLKDIAARDFLINVATSTPTMTNNFGDIRESVDVDMIMNRLSQMLEEEVATSVVMG